MKCENITERINSLTAKLSGEIRIMEVCGTHTHAIFNSGIRHILPDKVRLLSGPGCPVCVTHESYIDTAIEMLLTGDVLIASFGDMLKVCGTNGSLAEMNARYGNVYTVYSPEDAITLAHKNRDKTVVFAAVGFETTAPVIAATVKNVYENGPDNLLFYTSLKRMEPVLRLILGDERCGIDGIICPGHVAAVTGANAFRFIADEYSIPCVICGFEASDIAEAVCVLLEQIGGNHPSCLVNSYGRCVSESGNKTAQKYINELFSISDADWRGIGSIKNSALVLNEKYESLDAAKTLSICKKKASTSLCRCGDILLGIKTPYECEMFGKGCLPAHPLGPCMVSAEGACAEYYRNRGSYI